MLLKHMAVSQHIVPLPTASPSTDVGPESHAGGAVPVAGEGDPVHHVGCAGDGNVPGLPPGSANPPPGRQRSRGDAEGAKYFYLALVGSNSFFVTAVFKLRERE